MVEDHNKADGLGEVFDLKTAPTNFPLSPSMCLVSFQWSILTHKTRWISAGFVLFVRLIGLEPTQPELPDPKSGASTNFATGAGGFAGAKVVKSF